MSDKTLEDRKPVAADTGDSKADKTDRILLLSGMMIAGLAAFFPWYVFLNQDEFGVRPVGLASSRDLPEVPGRAVVSPSPLAIPDNDRESPSISLDTISTATINSGGEERPPEEDAVAVQEQAFPKRTPTFRLLHVVNGRALIEDGKGMYMVRIGSILPDDSRLATLEKRNGRWVIVTSEGTVIDR